MGVSVRQKIKKKGKPYWVFIRHKNQRTSRQVGNEKATKAVAARIQAEIALGTFVLTPRTPTSPTLRAHAQSWLKLYAQMECKESTVREYQSVLRNHILPALGDYQLDQISREGIRLFLATKTEQGLARGTLRNILAPLRKMLNDAVKTNLLRSNPTIGLAALRRPKTEHEVQPWDILSRDELTKVLASAHDLYSHFYELILCAARTGMREGELVALRWRNVDLTQRLIQVRRTFYKGRETSTKGRTFRYVDCSAQLIIALTSLRQQRMAEAVLQGNTLDPDSYVFTNRHGNRLLPGNFTKRIWGPLLLHAGIRHVRFHDLRHTYASLLLAQGESLAYIQRQLGHSSIQVTVDIYGHLVPGANRDAVDRLDATPNGTLPAPTPSEQ